LAAASKKDIALLNLCAVIEQLENSTASALSAQDSNLLRTRDTRADTKCWV
jgi:hypothetical protein